MNGHIIQGTPIAVDFWDLRRCPPNICLFFLSHLHTDHVQGLKSTWKLPIFTSPITGKLLTRYLKVKPHLVKVLELGQAHIVPVGDGTTVTVTLIDAHHCPGSVMFLFQGHFGNILYTGDFRYEPDILETFFLYGCQSIHTLYLDNTYCLPKHDHPPRAIAGNTIVRLIQDNPQAMIGICMRKVGKENLLVKIARELREWIVVDADTYEKMKLLTMPDVFETDERAGRVRVIPFGNRMGAKLVPRGIPEWGAPPVIIVPTALFCSSKENTYERRGNVYYVPYSDHSNYLELFDFVAKVRPRRVVPIVRGDQNYIDMSVFNRLLSGSPSPALDLNPPRLSKLVRKGSVSSVGKVASSMRSAKSSVALLAKGVVYLDVESEPPPASWKEGNDSEGQDEEVTVLVHSLSDTSQVTVASDVTDVLHYNGSSSEEEATDRGIPGKVEPGMATETEFQMPPVAKPMEEPDSGILQRVDVGMQTNAVVPRPPKAKQTENIIRKHRRKGNSDMASSTRQKVVKRHDEVGSDSKGDGGRCGPATLEDGDCTCMRFWKLDAAIVEALRRGGECVEPVIIPKTRDCKCKKL